MVLQLFLCCYFFVNKFLDREFSYFLLFHIRITSCFVHIGLKDLDFICKMVLNI